jgi:hypothetical protein
VRRSPTFAIPLALPILGALATGCSCPASNIVLDDFEGCSGTCGWTIAGAGTVTIVSTILPGEHGMQMTGGIVASKAVSPTIIDDTYSLSMVANCPDGIGATLTAAVPNAPDLMLSVQLAIDDSLSSSGDAPDYTGVTYVPLAGGVSFPSGITSVSVNRVTLEPAAGGTCTVDLIELQAATPCD